MCMQGFHLFNNSIVNIHKPYITMTDKLIITYHPLANGLQMAQARINKPKTLNAIDLDIIDAFYQQLLQWQSDESIALVLLDSEGEKAFCAGGDVVSLYHAIKDDRQANTQSLIDFFGNEYRMNYLMHTYTKPILCWGHGIVMGGGKGLFAGCSHRVVTETSVIAMPEVTIGLFPDVGGSWFLSVTMVRNNRLKAMRILAFIT